jgi:hypothetical protein
LALDPYNPPHLLPTEEIRRQRKAMEEMQAGHKKELAELRKLHAAQHETLRHGPEQARRLIGELRAWSHEYEGRPLNPPGERPAAL